MGKLWSQKSLAEDISQKPWGKRLAERVRAIAVAKFDLAEHVHGQ
jgi:hypothetical protein